MTQAPGDRRRRWVAIITGVISVLIGVLYLALIIVLDSRGAMVPPPPEALGLPAKGNDAPRPRAAVEAVGDPSPAGAARLG